MVADEIDRSALGRLQKAIGNDRPALEELINDFRELSPRIVERMHASLAKGDVNGLRISAHELKSNAKDFGATHLSALCEELEASCAEQMPPSAHSLVTDIDAAMTGACDALHKPGLLDE